MPDPVLVEYFNEHWYKVTVDGKTRFIPSVTTKLGILDKPYLLRWYADLGYREASLRKYEAAEKGKRIHWAYAVSLKGGAVIYDPWQNPVYTPEGIAAIREKYKEVAVLRTQEEMWDICKLAEQFKRLSPKILGVEETVVDLEENDAGTIDSIFYIEKGEYLIAGSKPLSLGAGVYINDLKSGSSVTDDVWLQLAPYSVIWEKKHGIQCAGALVTHTGASVKTGIPGLKTSFCPRDLLQEYYRQYRNIAKVWEDKHKDDQPETFEFPSLVTMKLAGDKKGG